MEILHTMSTLTEVLAELRLKKMDAEFRWTKKGFTADKLKIYQPENLMILETYRFEGMSNPSDTCILYLIRASDGITGYSLDSYGAYGNHESGYYDFIRQIIHFKL